VGLVVPTVAAMGPIAGWSDGFSRFRGDWSELRRQGLKPSLQRACYRPWSFRTETFEKAWGMG